MSFAVNSDRPSGALALNQGQVDFGIVNTDSYSAYFYTFNASRSNSIYGESDTVMIDSYNLSTAIYLG